MGDAYFDAKDAAMGIADEIVEERVRQRQNENYSPVHDDDHKSGELARAAAAYALHAAVPHDHNTVACVWPFLTEEFNGKDPRRDLVRAGALILAEIERLDRQPP